METAERATRWGTPEAWTGGRSCPGCPGALAHVLLYLWRCAEPHCLSCRGGVLSPIARVQATTFGLWRKIHHQRELAGFSKVVQELRSLAPVLVRNPQAPSLENSAANQGLRGWQGGSQGHCSMEMDAVPQLP